MECEDEWFDGSFLKGSASNPVARLCERERDSILQKAVRTEVTASIDGLAMTLRTLCSILLPCFCFETLLQRA